MRNAPIVANDVHLPRVLLPARIFARCRAGGADHGGNAQQRSK